MKKGIPLFAIGFGILFVVLTTLRDNKDYKDLKLMKAEVHIKSIKMNIIHADKMGNVKITIADKNILDSINYELINNLKPSEENMGGVSMLFVILEINKRTDKFEVNIVNSKYYGWLLEVGGKCYTNDYIFRLVQTYVDNYKDKEVQ